MVFISPKIFIQYFFCERTMSLFHIYLFTPTFLLLCAKDHLGLRLCAHALPAPSMANNHWNAGVVSCQWLRVSSQCSSGLPPTGVPTKGCAYQRVCLPTGVPTNGLPATGCLQWDASNGLPPDPQSYPPDATTELPATCLINPPFRFYIIDDLIHVS